MKIVRQWPFFLSLHKNGVKLLAWGLDKVFWCETVLLQSLQNLHSWGALSDALLLLQTSFALFLQLLKDIFGGPYDTEPLIFQLWHYMHRLPLQLFESAIDYGLSGQ